MTSLKNHPTTNRLTIMTSLRKTQVNMEAILVVIPEVSLALLVIVMMALGGTPALPGPPDRP